MKTAKIFLTVLIVLLSATTVVRPGETTPQAEFVLIKTIDNPEVGVGDTLVATLTVTMPDFDFQRPVMLEDPNPAPEYLEIENEGGTCRWPALPVGRNGVTRECRMRVIQAPPFLRFPIANTAWLTEIVASGSPFSTTDTAGIVILGNATTYLPVVYKGHAFPLENGNFSRGPAGWTQAKGPFQGHGSGLDTSIALCPVGATGANCARLGVQTATNGSIPVGYGYFAQSFNMQGSQLHVRFQIRSYDKAWAPVGQKYFDTFEVSVNKLPTEITTAERHARGCQASPNLPPTDPVPVTEDGLVFCSGGTGAHDSGWNSGWVTLKLAMSQEYQLYKPVTLYLTLWSREHESPWWDDKAYYNTWVFVDRVTETSN